MSKINIEGIVRDINGKTTYITPLVEAICNSIDAIGEKKNGTIDIVLKRDNQLSIGDLGKTRGVGSIVSIDIIDNGKGFDKENRESFDTYKSGYKYKIGGKGFGRFMYLKYFNSVSIESIYKEGIVYRKRTFTFGHNSEIIENENDNIYENQKGSTGTVLHLSAIKKNANIDKGLDVIARKIVEKILVFFGDQNLPTITLRENDDSNKIVLNHYVNSGGDIELILEDKKIDVYCKRNSVKYIFGVNVYKIFHSNLVSRICLTANNREVTDTAIHNYVPEFKETLFEVTESGQTKNYSVLVCVVGKYLDANVSMERDSFEFSKESDALHDLSQSEIEREAAFVAKSCFLESMNERYGEKRQKVVSYVNDSAPWHKTLLDDIDMESMPMGISDEELEMRFQKAKFEKEQKTRIAIREIMSRQDNEESEEAIEDQVNEILRSVSETGKNDLAHYVCTRKKVLDLFESLRRRDENGKAHLERELHNLIFPMISNDIKTEYDNHNLWLLDERLVFSQYVASDKVISKVEHDEPDLAVFFKERMFYRNGDNIITSPVAIFEFKRPRRTNYPDDENPINQACRYARKILDGKYEMPDGAEPVKVDKAHTPVYIYIVCDIVPKIKEFADEASLTVSPDEEGYFGYMPKFNAYVELKSYRKLVEDANMRNKIFFKKLGIE